MKQADFKESVAEDYNDISKLEECDIIMKGGVTSGVVYGAAIAQIAQKYRFRNIGGTSAGAIGAVITAAAEYRRQKDKTPQGFIDAEALSDELGEGLGDIFQPNPKFKRLYNGLIELAGPKPMLWKAFCAFVMFLVGYWLVTLVSLCLAYFLSLSFALGK